MKIEQVFIPLLMRLLLKEKFNQYCNMPNLITCKTCGNQISSSAENCPNCGHTHEKDRIDKKNNIQVFMLLGLLILGIILWKTGLFEIIKDKFFGDLKFGPSK